MGPDTGRHLLVIRLTGLFNFRGETGQEIPMPPAFIDGGLMK